MRKFLYISISLFVTLFCVGCDYFALFDEPDFGEQNSEVADHAMIFYVMADNNLRNSLAENVKQIAQSVGSDFAEGGRIVIYYDRSDSTTLLQLKANDIRESNWRDRFEVLKRYEKQNCASVEVLSQVMEDVKALVPSKSYGIVFSGHGGGWFPNHISSGTTNDKQKVSPLLIEHAITIDPERIPLTRWYGYDGSASNANSFMTTEGMVEGLSEMDLDYIIFDACYMSSIEMIYELRNTTDYIIASPAEIMAYGFPYREIIPMIFEQEASLVDVAEQFVDYYKNRYTGTYKCAAVAAIDCSQLEPLAQSVKAIYDMGVLDVDLSKVQALESLSTDHAYFDMMSYFSLAAPDMELLDNFRNAFNKAVAYSDHTARIYAELSGRAGYVSSVSPDGILSLCGVNCYVPRDHLPITKSYWEQSAWGRAVLGR
ncbi:MAG: hypothetical protein J6Q40_05385 [Tidjanibacter sp.]|nr:hypothetical protein [Tidjanibacter sp.]